MDFLISSAWAQNEAQQGDIWFSIMLLVGMIALFYFLLIRPQSKRAKEHRQMVEDLTKGDEVVTNGGLLGRITQVGENFATVEVANGLQVQIQKHAVANVMPKGTIKELENKKGK
ncbi:preprotein translocase subunit YajC [Halorhodospira halochloris]|uniref:Sec translocon accessory complex subunit YajC n=1 Tax=Halorhodospira halochloris TaxID=1052 RepID=A0A120MZY6_HALHR|nr:preprotein translocase subunit YajC [Halorhodospira halochloris]MBK1652602.1 preprotein translocase subunit YajC [Halorhodospira halochloris]MCG5530393.1 preprotein translocase subunit YajC [Halorhodospira halochloris]MCG5548635.1 preprotein translocase subunit YajC [Halorhodospira halochloris]BAU58193.1 preprotein translocase subunit YajC [Halorhodospira halochloris]